MTDRGALFPSPLWGGERGGGKPYIKGSGVPPSLSLPHKGGGDSSTEGGETARHSRPGSGL
jgi:hypothetical protein